jgi:cytochrome c-type biogenesis protein CcmF
MLYKNEPKKMGKYMVTYVSDTTISPNTFYKINFKVIDKDGKVKEDFDVNPSIQENNKMGMIASPDTKHYLTTDIYTHLTSAAAKKEEHGDHDGHSDNENYKKPRLAIVKIGDTIRTSNAIVTVKTINSNPVVKDLRLAPGDLAFGLVLEVNVVGKIYHAEPLLLLKKAGNGAIPYAFDRKIEDLGLKFSFSRVIPEEGKVEFNVFEKPQQAKDWLVFKSIEFPFINLYWVGTIVMVIGFLISIFRRKKELKTT